MKIKEEQPADATMNTDTINNYKFLRSRSKQSDDDQLLLSEKNGALRKHVNHKTKRCVSDNCSESPDGAGLTKVISLKRKRTRTKNDHICDISPIPKKKQKYSDKISINGHTNVFKATIKNFNEKRERQSIVSESNVTIGTRFQKKRGKQKNLTMCDICFVTFKTIRNCKLHQHYYMRTAKFRCRHCNNNYITQAKLHLHILKYHRKIPKCHINYLQCHYCKRKFRNKYFLQSHLFHLHSKYIYQYNIKKTKAKHPKIVPKSTSCKNHTLKNVSHEEPRLNNSDKLKESCTTLIKDSKQSGNNDTTKNDKSTEKPSNEDMTPAKKLRQLTLNEYLEFCKRKRNIKTNLKQVGSSTCASSPDEQVEESLIAKSPEEAMYNRQMNTSIEKSSNNLGQVAHVSTSKQKEKHSTKEPFVKLHANVETMKCFLESLPDANIKSEVIQDQTNNIMLHDHNIPYKLRPTRAIRFLGHSNKNLLRKSRLKRRNSTETEQRVAGLDKVDSNTLKTIMVRSNCKDCTIPLKRCDGKLKNRHSVSTILAGLKEKLVSTITEPNSTQSETSDAKNNVVLKELEISLERLKTERIENNLKVEMDAEIQNGDCFTCEICMVNFPTISNKDLHVKLSHVAYMSSICNARYTTKYRLLQHYLREHIFRSNQCCVCNELLSDFIKLKQHLNHHCLKYIQNKDDQYPLNVDIKCSTKETYTCFKCGKILSSHLGLVHDCYGPIREEMGKVQENSIRKTNMSSDVILPINNDDANESTITHDERIQNDELLNNKPAQILNKIQTTSVNEKSRNNEEELKIIEDLNIIEENLQIDENNQNSFSRKAIFIVEDIKDINESQEPNKFSEANNLTVNDQATTNVQSNVTESVSRVYPCGVCGKKFQNLKNWEQHMRIFSRATEFCPLCNTAFSSKRYLQTHIAAAHVPQLSKNYDFHCVFCNQGFLKKCELRPHVLHLHGRQMLEAITPDFHSNQEKSNGNVTCCICNLAFESPDRYMEHKMYYYKNHKFRCLICSKDFQGMYMYHHHNKFLHYPEDKRKSYNYKCDICNEGFTHELHLHSHNMHVHPNKENLTKITKQLEKRDQPVIDVEKEDKEMLYLYMNQQKRTTHLSSTDYICQICQFQCADAKDLKNHELFYTNGGDFKCNLCNRQCKTLDLLDQHKSLSHICRDVYNEHVCNNCGEVLTSIVSLKCHEKHFHANLASHDNANNCKDCDQTFSSPTEYQKHQCKSTSSKTKEKYIYRCFYCDMKFISLEIIQAHIIHVHFSKLLDKHVTKTGLNTVSDDKSQKKSIPQLVDQVLVSRRNVAQSFQQSVNDSNSTLTTQETQNKVVVEPTPDQLKTLFLLANETNKQNILVPAITANRSEANNASSTMEKEQNDQCKTDAPVTSVTASTESTNESKKHHRESLSDSLNISLEQMLDGHSIFSSLTGSTNKSKETFTNIPSKPVNGSNLPISVAPIPRKEETTAQKYVSVNNSTDYVCPLCSLQYPSLMFFHAHLRYAHSELIRNDLVSPQLDQLTEKIPAIECLLCPRICVDEKRYKIHLRCSHSSHVYPTNLNEMRNINNSSTSPTTRIDNNTRSKSPEIITVDDDDDDDDDNRKNSTVELVAIKETTPSTSSTGNENIGKLKVKSFAKIIENLAIDRAMELLKKNN